MMRSFIPALLASFPVACSLVPEVQLVSGHEFMKEDASALRSQPIENTRSGTYRLLWHPWHQNAALVSATCDDPNACTLTVTRTDGRGTYSVGRFRDRTSVPISPEEYAEVKASFAALPSIEPQRDILPTNDAGEIETICLHSSSYALEANEDGKARSIYRHCHPNYADDFKIARPLIALGWAKFPDLMKSIDPIYLATDGEDRTFSDIR